MGGYWVNWVGTPPGNPSGYFDARMFTHIFYAFAFVNATDCTVYPRVSSDTLPSPNGGYAVFHSVVRAANPAVKTLLSIGGGGFPPAVFTACTKNATLRATFAANAVAYAKKYGFDGIDWDWEFPDGTKAQFALHLAATRAAITQDANVTGGPPLLHTIAAAAYPKQAWYDYYDVAALNANLDFVNVMMYDFHDASWECGATALSQGLICQTGPNTMMYPNKTGQFSITGGVTAWLAAGLQRRKLVLGLAMYSHAWTLKDAAANSGMWAPASGGAGDYLYKNIKTLIAQSTSKTYYDATTQTNFVVYNTNKWISYDDAYTIAIRVNYTRTQGLGGYFYWEIDGDDAQRSLAYSSFTTALAP